MATGDVSKATTALKCNKLVKHFRGADSGCVRRSLWDMEMCLEQSGTPGNILPDILPGTLQCVKVAVL